MSTAVSGMGLDCLILSASNLPLTVIPTGTGFFPFLERESAFPRVTQIPDSRAVISPTDHIFSTHGDHLPSCARWCVLCALVSVTVAL